MKGSPPRWRFVVLLPLLISLFDLLENAAIIIIAATIFPAEAYPVNLMAAIATDAKWSFAAATAATMAAGGLLRLCAGGKR